MKRFVKRFVLIVLLCLIGLIAGPAFVEATGNAEYLEGAFDGIYDISLSNGNGQYFTTEGTAFKVAIYGKNWILFYGDSILLAGNIVPTVRVLFFLNGTKIASVDISSGKGNTLSKDWYINFRRIGSSL